MPKPAESSERKVLAMPGELVRPAGPAQRRARAMEPEKAADLLLAGRHYRLIPVDDCPDEIAGALPAAEVLTSRELQIVVLVAEGHVNKQIADILRISEWTVSTHLRRIFAKLHVDTRAAMVSRCCGRVVAFRPPE